MTNESYEHRTEGPREEEAESASTAGDTSMAGSRSRRLRERIDLLEQRLYSGPKEGADPMVLVRVQASLDRARSELNTGGVAGILSRRDRLNRAEEYLRTAESALGTLAGAATTVEAPDEVVDSNSSAADHGVTVGSEKQLSTSSAFLVGGITVAAALFVIFIAGSNSLRGAIGVGAAAGLAVGLPGVMAAIRSHQGNGAWLLAIYKLLAGATAAVIAVLLLRNGFGALEPATGRAALFYALIFGAVQEILSGRFESLVVGSGPADDSRSSGSQAGRVAASEGM